MRNLLIILLSISTLASCDDKDPSSFMSDCEIEFAEHDCDNPEDQYEGIIIEFFPNSNACVTLLGDEIVVNDESDLDSLLCNAQFAVIPPVDLETETLLGMRVTGSGCDRYFHHSVCETEENVFLYEIQKYECGECEPFYSGMHLVSIPKINDAAIVNFSFLE